MWILLTLLSAVGAAGVGLTLKPALALGSPLRTTVAYRAAGGLVLLPLALAAGLPADASGVGYAGALALVIPFEVLGTVAMTLALRSGDVSLVQPLFGLLPVVVLLGGAAVLGERPTALALAGVGLVTAGVYGLGLDGTRGALAPLRAVVRTPAGRWTLVAVGAWSVTTLVHTAGIAAVGALPWAATLALGSAVAMAVVGPLLPRDLSARPDRPRASARRWAVWAGACGGLYAVQQIGLQLALGMAPVSYVTALGALSLVLAVAGGLVFLNEPVTRWRVGGAGLVTAGVLLVSLFG